MERIALVDERKLPAADEVRFLAANAAWLLLLRWVAVGGQLMTIVAAQVVFRVDLPSSRLLLVIAVTALSNFGFATWVRWLHRVSPTAVSAHGVRITLATVMALDIVSLTALLYFAGGSANPFSVFYLVNLALCGVILSARWGLALTLVAAAGMVILLAGHVELAELNREVGWLPGSRLSHVTLGQLGRIVAMATCGLVIILFAARVTHQLELTAGELRRVERERSRSEKLEALGTLAGGAAHELATPLSTIAVVSKELIRELEQYDLSESVHEDMALIRAEVGHCQTILQRMTGRAGRWIAEQDVEIDVAEFVRHTLSEMANGKRLHVTLPERANDVRLRVPLESLAQAVRGLLQNALDATTDQQPVQLIVSWDSSTVQLVVQDEGSGMTDEVLARAGEPFFTTKEPGRGMGLGLFLTRSVIERLGGRFHLSSSPGEGATAVVELPRIRSAAK
jgi:two-component system sensor histidine kinase RegB